MSNTRVQMIETGVANTASMSAAFERLGAHVEFVTSPSQIEKARLLVLPGVGAFGSGVEFLDRSNLRSVIVQRCLQGRPILAVCLGLQLLCRRSEETPGAQGLGLVPADLTAFPDDVMRPQFGWNRVIASQDDGLIRDGYAYFANTYRLERKNAPAGWEVAVSDHGGQFVAAMESGAMLACQFHPEISGQWGSDLLKRWIIRAEEFESC